jgi:hypothetical protein
MLIAQAVLKRKFKNAVLKRGAELFTSISHSMKLNLLILAGSWNTGTKSTRLRGLTIIKGRKNPPPCSIEVVENFSEKKNLKGPKNTQIYRTEFALKLFLTC